jgi:cAMP-dependent protein kinase regulator
MVDEI